MINDKLIFARRLFNIIRMLPKKLQTYHVKYNVNKSREQAFKKRALLVYLIMPFQIKQKSRYFLHHQNMKQCRQIADIISEYGYIVDVADVNDANIKSDYEYDLIISHKIDLNVSRLRCKNHTKFIYLGTGMNHIVHNRNLRKRLDGFTFRRNCSIEIELHTENMPFLKIIDAIITFGNDHTKTTWNESFKGPIYTFNNYGYNKNNIVEKKYSEAKKNFLFFGGRWQLLKGLDLLLEVFSKHPKLHLHICGRYYDEIDFCKCYQKELFHMQNIHPVGWVKVNSREFDDLLRKCLYVIMPSCSEGQSGAVVQCMHSGLIPIVTRQVGIDTGDFGVNLRNDSLQELERTVKILSAKPDDWCQGNSIKTIRDAKYYYSEDYFLNRWREILLKIGI